MPTGSGGIFPKVAGNLIYAADYNDIQGTVEFLLGTGLSDSGYGQAVTSAPVSVSSDKITVAQWNSLRSELLKIRQHQTGVSESANLPIPTTSVAVDDAFVNTYKTFATTCQTNRLVMADTEGIPEDLFNPVQERVTAWNSLITHIVTISWPTANDARYFFNAGGEIRFSASRSGGTTTGDVPNKNQTWTNLFNNMGTIKFGSHGTTYTGSGAQTVETSKGWYEMGTTSTQIFVMPAQPGKYTENDYNISATRDTNDSSTAKSITFRIEFRDDDTGDQRPGYKPGPAVDESVDGTLRSFVKSFRPNTPNVTLPAPSAVKDPSSTI